MSDLKPIDCLTELRNALDGLSPDRKAALTVPSSVALSVFVQGWMQACSWGSGAPSFATAIADAYQHLTREAAEPAVAPA